MGQYLVSSLCDLSVAARRGFLSARFKSVVIKKRDAKYETYAVTRQCMQVRRKIGHSSLSMKSSRLQSRLLCLRVTSQFAIINCTYEVSSIVLVTYVPLDFVRLFYSPRHTAQRGHSTLWVSQNSEISLEKWSDHRVTRIDLAQVQWIGPLRVVEWILSFETGESIWWCTPAPKEYVHSNRCSILAHMKSEFALSLSETFTPAASSGSIFATCLPTSSEDNRHCSFVLNEMPL